MIEIRHVYKYYEKRAWLFGDVELIRAFTVSELTIREGEVIGLLGENGAGKSSLLRAIMGLTPYDGKITVDGRPVCEHAEDLAFITEEGSFPDFLSAEAYGAFLADLLPRFDRERYDKLLRFFELPRNQRAGSLSNGQQAKLEVAAGFSKGAKYILMDEPFLGKDIFTRRDFLKLMAGALRGNETVIVSTHQIEEIENFLDRAIILHDHEIAADVSIDDLRAQGKTLVGLMQEVTGYDPARYRDFTF